MIAEALHYAASYFATPPEFRQHIAASVSLWSRGRRCRKHWAAHEANCKAFITREVAKMKQRRTCVVLGSGLLRDVPIDVLTREFDTVVLIDLAHLRSARMVVQRQKKSRNVKFIHRDVAELERSMSGQPFEVMAFLRDVPFLDLVISANLLSQIGVAAVDQLDASGRAKDIPTIVPKLIGQHLDRLASLPCTALLLTDVSLETKDRQGEVIERYDLLHGVEVPQFSQSWPWPVAPFGEESKDYLVEHRVIATNMT